MERNTRGFSSQSSRRDRLTSGNPGQADRFDPLNPASRLVNRSLRAADYAQFSRTIHRDLNPQGPLEILVTRQAVRSAWRLREKLEVEVSDPISEIARSDADRAARSLEVAITTLDVLQGRRDGSALPLVTADETDQTVIQPNEWPVLPFIAEDLDRDEAEVATADDDDRVAEELADDPPIWRDRLVYDFDVSEDSPVVRGTWITVSHVVSLIVDGATWAEILRTHPELTEADIRVCVAYAVAEDSSIL